MSRKYNIWLIDSKECFTSSVIKGLSTWNEANIHILSTEKNTRNKYSRYISSFHKLPDDNNNWIEFIKELTSKHENNLIVPVAEPEIRFVIQNKSILNKFATVADVPELKMYDIAINKGLLSAFLDDKKLPQPCSWYCENKDDWDNLPHDFKGAVLIKPTRGDGGEGIIKCNSISEAKCFSSDNNLNKNKGVVIQEYIEGSTFSYSAFCENGEVYDDILQEEIIPSNILFEPAYAIKFIKNAEITKISKQLIKELNWDGVISLNLCKDNTTGKIYILEVNGRYWASLVAALVMNINFPLMACRKALGLSHEIKTKKYGYYAPLTVALKCFLKSFKNKDVLTFNLWKGTSLRYLLLDPIQTLFITCFKINCALSKNK